MNNYQAKPIKAVQWIGTNILEVDSFLKGLGVKYYLIWQQPIEIQLPIGILKVELKDFIIKDTYNKLSKIGEVDFNLNYDKYDPFER